jgi:hypothetical protein
MQEHLLSPMLSFTITFLTSSLGIMRTMRLDSGIIVLSCNDFAGNRDLNALLAELHLSRESAVGLPIARVTGSRLLQHFIDLLEG